MKFRYLHYRVPEHLARIYDKDKGEPRDTMIVRYSRSVGWMERTAFYLSKWPRPWPKGGATVCILEVGDDKFVGWTVCSMSDNFCYAVGRDIAQGRALKKWLQRKARPTQERESKDMSIAELRAMFFGCLPDEIDTIGLEL